MKRLCVIDTVFKDRQVSIQVGDQTVASLKCQCGINLGGSIREKRQLCLGPVRLLAVQGELLDSLHIGLLIGSQNGAFPGSGAGWEIVAANASSGIVSKSE